MMCFIIVPSIDVDYYFNAKYVVSIGLVLKVLDGRQINGDGDVCVSGIRIPE